MSNKKQTLLDSLFNELDLRLELTNSQWVKIERIFDEHKEIYKQEIIKAYEIGFSDGWMNVKYDKSKYLNAEQYYKDNYE